MRLKDKIAVVTASTRGIGATQETFAREGASIFSCSRAERAKIMIDRLTKEDALFHLYIMMH